MFLFIKVDRSGLTFATPYISEDEDTYHVRAEGGVEARLKKRSAYPGTFCRKNNDRTVLGYGSEHPKPDDEFLHIAIGHNGDIELQRDHYCTLPLFYGFDRGTFVVSNDYQAVVESLDTLTLSDVGLRRQLFATLDYLGTWWQEVGIIGERQRLTFKEGEVSIRQPAPRAWTYNDELPDTNPRQFPDILASRFDKFIDSKLSNEVVGFEISGGMDSSFLPLYLAAKGDQRQLIGGSLVLPDPERNQQLTKLNDLEHATNLHLRKIYIDPLEHCPLAGYLDDTSKYVPPYLDLYDAGFAQIADYFQTQGVSVLVFGAGGDDLLEHRPRPEHNADIRYQEPTPPFYTAKAAHPLMELSSARTLLPPNTIVGNISHNNTYIERDIWPVSPFYDVPLFYFCQGLPVQFRANKNIFRAYYQARDFPASLYRGTNENFENFTNASWLSAKYAGLIVEIARSPYLEQLGYIDTEIILDGYKNMQQTIPNCKALFQIYTWIQAELSIRTAVNLGQFKT